MAERRQDESTRERLSEIAEGYARTDATVLRLLNRYQAMLWLMVALFILGAGSSIYFYDQNHIRAKDNRVLALRAGTLARENARALAKAEESIVTARQAIVTGCQLLVRLSRQAGVAPTRAGASQASRLNLALTITVIDEVLRTAPPVVQARITDLYHRLQRAGPVITLPNCKTVGKQPPEEP